MDKIIEKILEFVELDGELTAESTLKGDCGLTSFEMVCLSQELCAELGVDESTVNLRACKTVGDLAKAFGV